MEALDEDAGVGLLQAQDVELLQALPQSSIFVRRPVYGRELRKQSQASPDVLPQIGPDPVLLHDCKYNDSLPFDCEWQVEPNLLL